MALRWGGRAGRGWSGNPAEARGVEESEAGWRPEQVGSELPGACSLRDGESGGEN